MNNFNNSFPPAPEHFHNMVLSTLEHLPQEQEIITMKKLTFKKTLVFALVAALALSTTAFAMGSIHSIVSSSGKGFSTLPTEKQLEENIGAVPQMLQSFGNDFAFKDGHLSKVEGKGESGSTLERYNSYNLAYAKGNEVVNLSLSPCNASGEETKSEDFTDYKGITIYSSSTVQKLVTEGYQMTPQDIADMESGVCTFNVVSNSKGSDSVVESTLAGVSWTQEGVIFSLWTEDATLTQQNLYEMAQQLIDLQ
ncbi:MAG: hypothetical protein RR162_04070 [Oscillospiraceae bacterium]